MQRLTLLVFLLGCAACAPEPMALSASLHVSTRFDADQTEAVLAAVDEWHTATRGRVALRPVISEASDQFERVRPGKLDGSHLGEMLPADWYDTDRGHTITIDVLDVERFGASIKSVAMHEIGHALGLEHARAGLMVGASSCQQDCIDSATLAEFCELRGCPDGYVDTCLDSGE